MKPNTTVREEKPVSEGGYPAWIRTKNNAFKGHHFTREGDRIAILLLFFASVLAKSSSL
jgi:hypothetical protein